MPIETSSVPCEGFRFSVKEGEKELGRGHLFVMSNDLHAKPFGFMEDVWIDPDCRGGGIGSRIVNALIRKARKLGCYKLVATSRDARPRVHALYERLGFENYGREFRMNFES